MKLKFLSSALVVAVYTCVAIIAAWGHKPALLVAQEKYTPLPTKLYYGVAACSNGGCHNNAAKPNQADVLLCDYDEVKTWSKFDKHKNGIQILKGDRAEQMGKRLGLASDIATAKECVSCHGVLVTDATLKHSSFRLEDGVSCVACHGAYKEWVGKHSDFFERDRWRKLSRKMKEERYGMRDLWDPEKRATLCASCHIGKTEEGKIVTHAMYAAGHPPLPSIEMATFSDAMPRHWKYLAEKSPKVQAILEYDPARGDLERTQLTVIGGLVTLRESMSLLASQASQDEGKNWPELAQFDCFACHHDLKAPSWRQKRGYAGKPGRPAMHPWPTALAPLGVRYAAQGDAAQEKKRLGELHDKIKALSTAIAAQPFGAPKQVAQAARHTAQWADALLLELRGKSLNRSAADHVLFGLGEDSRGRWLDFDSARQFAWAARSIQHELDPKFGAATEATHLLKELDGQLGLDLPRGQIEISKSFLKDALKKRGQFDPERFEQAFQRLVTGVGKRSQ